MQNALFGLGVRGVTLHWGSVASRPPSGPLLAPPGAKLSVPENVGAPSSSLCCSGTLFPAVSWEQLEPRRNPVRMPYNISFLEDSQHVFIN